MNEAQKTLVFYVLVLAASVGAIVILFIVASTCREAYVTAIPASRRAYIREQIVPTLGTLLVVGIFGWVLAQGRTDSVWALAGIFGWVILVRQAQLRRLRRRLRERNLKLYQMTGDYKYLEP